MIRVYIILSCLSLCYHLQAQEKNNTIIVSNDLELQENIKQVTEMLFELGYGIHSSDVKTGIITTTEKPYKNGSVKLNILVRAGKISIRGYFSMNVSINIGSVTSDLGWTMIENRGQKNSPIFNAWSEMNKLALLLPGEKTYETR
jgi:hypothetical protein